MKKLIIGLLSSTIASTALAGSVLTDAEYSHAMMDHNNNITRKQQLLFNSKHDLEEGSLYVGASFIGIANYQQSNRESKFGYLMRHPSAGNQVGKKASEAVVHSVQIQASGSLTPWLGVYTELLYNPEQSFGAGTITTTTRNQVQVRKAYAMIGDKSKSPFYLTLGKQDIPFGLMDSVSPFTNSSVWHAFGAMAYSAIAGLDYHGLNASLSAIQGGAQFRVANSNVNDTNVPSRLNNYAADINYTFKMPAKSFTLGASYIDGTTYGRHFPIRHFEPVKTNNGAVDIYGKIKMCNLTLQGEFVQTLKKFPGSHNPKPPLDEHAASKVSSFSIGGSYLFNKAIKDTDFTLSMEYSEFKAGPKDAPWHKQSQLVTGLSAMVKPNIKLFAEVIRTQGYVPLNLMSGDETGVTASDKKAKSDIFLIGLHATL